MVSGKADCLRSKVYLGPAFDSPLEELPHLLEKLSDCVEPFPLSLLIDHGEQNSILPLGILPPGVSVGGRGGALCWPLEMHKHPGQMETTCVGMICEPWGSFQRPGSQPGASFSCSGWSSRSRQGLIIIVCV